LQWQQLTGGAGDRWAGAGTPGADLAGIGSAIGNPQQQAAGREWPAPDSAVGASLLASQHQQRGTAMNRLRTTASDRTNELAITKLYKPLDRETMRVNPCIIRIIRSTFPDTLELAVDCM